MQQYVVIYLYDYSAACPSLLVSNWILLVQYTSIYSSCANLFTNIFICPAAMRLQASNSHEFSSIGFRALILPLQYHVTRVNPRHNAKIVALRLYEEFSSFISRLTWVSLLFNVSRRRCLFSFSIPEWILHKNRTCLALCAVKRA